MTIEEQAYVAIEALREIANPIEYMIRRLDQGQRFDGEIARRLVKDPHYLQNIATECLHKIASSPAEG